MPDEVAASLEEGVEIVEHHVSSSKIVKLAKPSDKSDVPVFSRILSKLLDERKKVRKMMKSITDPDELNILDKRQAAKKVACNSAYGILGTSSGLMPLPDLAAVTTYQGRMALEFTQRTVEEKYGAKVIAGDSVAHYTPVYVRYSGVLHIVTVDSLPLSFPNGGWCEDGFGKETCSFNGLETWTESGWTELRCLIRHRLDPAKKMIRVLTPTGMCDVTDDHSLLTPCGQAIKPGQLSVGDGLLHADLPPACDFETGISADEARIMGFFFGDGMRQKAIPQRVIVGNRDVREAFLQGIYDARSDNTSGYPMILAAQIYWLACSLDNYASIGTRSDKIIVRYSRLPVQKDPIAIKKLHPIDYPAGAYVYDITTANHHFSAGVGRMVVHNTDSVMFMLPEAGGPAIPEQGGALLDEWRARRMEYMFDKAAEIASDVSSRLPDPLELELEAVMYPSCFYKKKNYAARLWTRSDRPEDKLKMKGVVAVRNDWSRLTKELAGDVLRMSIKDNNPTGALSYLRETLKKMRNGNISSEMFVIKKQLHTWTPKTKSPHTQMALRIRNKDPAAAPVLGSKVEYVFRRGQEDISDRAYPPEEVSPVDIDVEFYFERQILKPLSELLSPMIDGGIGKLRRLLENEQARQREISCFIEGYTEKLQESGDRRPAGLVTKDDQEDKRTQLGLGKFFKSNGCGGGASEIAIVPEPAKRKVAQGAAKPSKKGKGIDMFFAITK
jgi:DNA polymerase family B